MDMSAIEKFAYRRPPGEVADTLLEGAGGASGPFPGTSKVKPTVWSMTDITRRWSLATRSMMEPVMDALT